ELALHVGDHPTRNLAFEDLRIYTSELAEELAITRSDFGEVLLDPQNACHIQSRVEAGPIQHLDQALRRIVPRTKRHGADGSVNNVATSLDGLHVRDQR